MKAIASHARLATKKFRDGQPFSLCIYYTVEFGWRGHYQYRMFGDDPPTPNNMSPGPCFA